MTHTFLVEIGLEEMPAHVVTPSIAQFKQKAADYLREQRIEFDDLKTFSTPRRLTLQITGLADKQPDVDTEVKGPAKKIALDEDGNWSKAAIGFTKGQGATTDEITFKEIKGTEYVYVKKHIAGLPVEEILAGFKDVIMSLTFPTMMRWGDFDFEYVRPIKWLVALLDEQVIPFTILDVTTGRQTRSHRFLGQAITLDSALDYEAALDKQFVIADAEKRKVTIRQQIEQLAASRNWQINIDADLLEEVNNLVEWPTAFAGDFDDQYLAIPDEVLITSMRDHQRFFYVQNQAGELLPHFVSVRNGDTAHLDNVIAGNQKVLSARLADAMFFYEEDQKHDLDYYVNRLKTVSFHDKISTMYEKMQRVQALAAVLGKRFGLTSEAQSGLARASQIYKFDLVTGMVGEFAELQGIMGEKYALLFGEKPATATAIREHYLPISADGDLPATEAGAVLAIADKIDSILTFFAAGMVPSGSNDPYALRRQATGIVRIIRAQGWHFDRALIDTLIAAEDAAGVAPDLDQAQQVPAVMAFLRDRVKVILLGEKVSHDVVDAVVLGPNTDLLDNFEAADTLTKNRDIADFKAVVEALNRVLRIAEKRPESPDLTVDPDLFENASERGLYGVIKNFQSAEEELDMAGYFAALTDLKDAINQYFEETMVMVDDERIQTNRLNQLQVLADLIHRVGDLNQLIVK